ncbi:MAG: 30S ribosomal protein S8 [bacterium]
MSMTDPVADMLTRIRNGVLAGHQKIKIPSSKMKAQIAGILRAQGFIQSYDMQPGRLGRDDIVVELREDDKKVLNGLKRVSKPGRRVYVGKEDIPKVLNGLGIAIISTSKGLMTDEEAREAGVGGEFVCEIW